jgi:hypothetical protein
MSVSLMPATAAIARFFPAAGDLYDAFSFVGDADSAVVLMAEGDLVIDAEGLVQTERLVPDLVDPMGEEGRLAGIVVTGNLVAPKAVLLEPDIDWSPRIKVFGSLEARSLCLGGSIVEIGGDLRFRGRFSAFTTMAC